LSELGWNAVPPESGLLPVYGQVTLEQQGRYSALAYQRMQREWSWVGVGFYWFFKQADEREKDSNAQYYFRMVEPDFTRLPVYQAIKEQAHQSPIMGQGWHQADHWAVSYQGNWHSTQHEVATFGDVLAGQPGGTATFTFEGNRLDLVTIGNGRLRVQVDQDEPVEINLSDESTLSKTKIVNTLFRHPHQIRIEVIEGSVLIDGYIVEDRPNLFLNRAGSVVMILAVLGGVWIIWKWRQER
jgi:hypothetical protein